MIAAKLFIKAGLSVLVLVFLIVVVATPSLYEVTQQSAGRYQNSAAAWKIKMGVTKSEKIQGQSLWEHTDDNCKTKPLHSGMQAAVYISLASVIVAVLATVGGYFTGNGVLRVVGTVFEVIQLVGLTLFVAAVIVYFKLKFDCEWGNYISTSQISDGGSLIYGFYLSCAALVLSIASVAIRPGTNHQVHDSSKTANLNNDMEMRHTVHTV
eukprot:TRINITY_DN4898_c0_g1_i1.p1 TRINITY_DN4898_c0_g1~~TRINITY_DN4898_c0_g1_i1.p1  ORF type:complete len:210 (+),score=52.23 TRINITY_DN4898_c0_g1_i1:78-707(+)